MDRQWFLSLFRQPSKGFALIETVIAVGLLGIIAVCFLAAVGTSYKVVLLADEQVTAKSLARSWMEYVEQLKYIYAPDDGEATYTFDEAIYDEIIADIPEGYTICSVDHDGTVIEFENNDINGIKGVPWDGASDAFVNSDASLQKITLVIKHHSVESFTLDGFKVKQ